MTSDVHDPTFSFMSLLARVTRHRTPALAVVVSAATAVSVVVLCGTVFGLSPTLPPRLISRLDVVPDPDGGSWGAFWDAVASPTTVFALRGLTSLTSTVAFLGAVALAIATLSLVVSAVSWVLMRWQTLVIRRALGATLHALFVPVGRELMLLGTIGGTLGLIGGAILATSLNATWPELLSHTARLSALLGAGIGIMVAALLLLGLVAFVLSFLIARDTGATLAGLRGDRVTPGGRLLAVQGVLAVLQVAGALTLIFASTLLLRGPALHDTRTGLPRADDTVTASLRFELLADNTPRTRAGAYARVLEAVGPEVARSRVALTSPGAWLGLGKALPVWAFCNQCFRGSLFVPVGSATVRVAVVSPGALSSMSQGAIRGREFLRRDTLDAPRVAVLNPAAARELFTGASPLGKQIRVGLSDRSQYTVVGVANVPVPGGLGSGGAVPVVYMPLLQHPPEMIELSVSTGAFARTRALAEAGGDRGNWRPLVEDAKPLSQQIDRRRAPLEWFGWLALAEAVAATVVAAFALWAVMAQTVKVRQREIAIRLALGASPRHVIDWILRRAARIAALGLWIGLVGARWVWDLLGSNPAGTTESGVVILGQLSMGLVLLAVLASWLPARRAARTDPGVLWSEN